MSISIDIFNIKQFKCFFDVVSKGEDIALFFTNTGLSVNVLNKPHTCFYNVKYDNAFFDNYSVSEPTKVIVDAEEFYRMLDSARKGESLTIKFENNQIQYIFIRDSSKRVIKTPVVDNEFDIPVPPSVDCPTSVDVNLTILKDIFNGANKVIKVGKLSVGVTDKNLVFQSTNDDFVEYNESVYDSLITGTDCNSEFTLNYLMELLKFKDINDIITLKIGDNIPLVWEITSPDRLVECGGLIAPRLNEE